MLAPRETDAQAIERLKAELAVSQRGLREFVIYSSFALVAVVTLLLLAYMVKLRDQLANSTDGDTKRLFPHMALGLPDGSVRAGLAILIVVGSLLSLMGAVFPELGIKTSEALTGVFGTILGFYFGRSGGAESAQAAQAMANAASAGAAAGGVIATAQQQTREAQQNLAESERSRATTLSTSADSLLAAAAALVETARGDKAKLTEELAKARGTLEAAKATGKPEPLEEGLKALRSQGPVALLVQGMGPALAPLVTAGTTAAALRALAEATAKVSPTVAPRWTARLLDAPYREDLVPQAIDEAYAARIMDSVTGAPALLQFMTTTRPEGVAGAVSPGNAVEFLKLVLHEAAALTIEDMWEAALPAGWQATVAAIQRRSLELQLESEIPADLMQPLGGFAAFFRALTAVQSAPQGLLALESFMAIVRAARKAGVPVVDLLS